jgi:2-phosphoglycolate phosphatase
MKLIGIDLDGTLEDSREDMVRAAHRVRARLGLAERTDAALRPWVNAGMDRLYRACFDDFLEGDPAGARYAEVKAAYDADYFDNVAIATRLYAGIAEALAGLSRLGALACITNKPEHISRRLLDELGVGRLFATVIGGDTCARAKPHPMMLATAAERCGFDAARGPVFMIGDTAADLELAHAFGATGVWCAWGYSTELDPAARVPHFIARTPQDLVAIIGRS